MLCFVDNFFFDFSFHSYCLATTLLSLFVIFLFLLSLCIPAHGNSISVGMITVGFNKFVAYIVRVYVCTFQPKSGVEKKNVLVAKNVDDRVTIEPIR